MSVQYQPGAEAEQLGEVAWHESREVGLGARYFAEVGRTLRSIEESPGRFPKPGATAIRRTPAPNRTESRSTSEARQAAHAAHVAAQLVADVARAVLDRFKAIGEGEDLRITRPDLVGCGLAARGRLVHMAAYRHAIRAEVGRGPVH